MSGERTVRVWDVPTRLFHWSLLALVVTAWFTGEGEGATAEIHRYAGEAVAGLIVFRVLWGFIGGERARFADFAAGPSAVVAHVRDLFSVQPKRYLGHNPLGGVAVFLLLAVVGAVVLTGLFSGGESAGGPFAGVWGLELSEVHEASFRVLQALVAVHLLGVLIESLKAKDTLIPAMVTGVKRRRDDEPGDNAKRAGAAALAFALVAGVLSSMWLMAQPSASTGASERHYERRYDD
ncbi:cytochrome b [alpha proteobacterium U9-1i]|nr:cytochrome b [alpha proteobacterium U9-1i]